MSEPRTRNRNKFWTVIFKCLQESKLALGLALLSMTALAITDLLRPWPLKIIFDSILLGNEMPNWLSAWLPNRDTNKTLAVVVISSFIVVIAVLRGTFAYVETYQTSRLGNRIAFKLRTQLFRHLQRLPLSFHYQSRRGELMTKLASDTSAVKSFFADSALLLGSHVLSIVGTFAVMFVMNWRLAVVVMATFPLLLWNIFYLHRRAQHSSRKQRSMEDGIVSRINEVLGTIHLIQAFGRENYEQRRFEEESQEYLDESLRNARIESTAARAVEITTAVGTFAVVLYGSLQVLDGTMTPGTVLVFSSYLHGLYRPIRRLVKLTIRLSRLQVSVQRICEIFECKDEIPEAANPIVVKAMSGNVNVNGVTFCYPDCNDRVLDNVSFQIAAGEHLAIVGASGAGKSTLLGLLLRLYDPQAGSIEIDGVDVRDYQLESMRGQIGIVMQDSMLLGATIFENISYGNLDATNEEVVEAAKAACAHEFITQLENGYSTTVGERGARLSGGQQRRIAIARAVIRKSPILILDEPMTGLDSDSELAVEQALKSLMPGRTTITITHDLQSANNADRVIVLEKGAIVEEGSPSELLRNNGTYELMYRRKHKTRSIIVECEHR